MGYLPPWLSRRSSGWHQGGRAGGLLAILWHTELLLLQIGGPMLGAWLVNLFFKPYYAQFSALGTVFPDVSRHLQTLCVGFLPGIGDALVQ